jgi:lipopolysaccharide transport system permease protein
MPTLLQFIHDIRDHRELVAILVQRNIKIRYKGSVLGFFWSLASPVFFILIYGTFLKLIARGFAFDLHVLVTGIIIWQFISLCTNDSLGAIVGNTNLIKKTAFPRIILPLATVLANLVNFLMSGLVLIAYLLMVHAQVQWTGLIWLPFIILTQTALCLGLATLISAANVFFRDTEHVLGHAVMAWFFLTPIIYPLSLPLDIIRARLPAWIEPFYFCNPMTGLIMAYRRILLGTPPEVDAWLPALSFVVCWVILVTGIAVFQKVQPRFGDEL